MEEAYPPRSLDWLLLGVHDLEPLLHWLYRPVPAEHAKKYFLCLQSWLVGNAAEELEVDPYLLSGTDDLLRIIGNAPFEIPTRPRDSYAAKKLWSACLQFSDFGIKVSLPATDFAKAPAFSLDELIEALRVAFREQAHRLARFSSEETVLINLAEALLRYLRQVRRVGEYVEIGEEITGEVESLIASLLASRFGVRLPAKDDAYVAEIVSAICRPAWEGYGR